MKMLNKFKIVPPRFVWILVSCFLYSCGGGDNNKIANLSLVDSLNALEVKDSTNKTPFDIAMQNGARIFEEVCQICHQKDGKGVSKIYPPFSKADYLMEDVNRGIRQALYGSDGNFKMTVNGYTYNGIMLAYGDSLNNEDIAAVLTYITNSWENKHGLITPEEVAKIRKEGKKNRENYN